MPTWPAFLLAAAAAAFALPAMTTPHPTEAPEPEQVDLATSQPVVDRSDASAQVR